MSININNRAHANELMAAGQISSYFEIVDGDDDQYPAGYEGNAFATREAAEDALAELRQLGEDWTEQPWSVREVTR